MFTAKSRMLILQAFNRKSAFFALNYIFCARKAKFNSADVIFVTCTRRAILVLFPNTVFSRTDLQDKGAQ